ncbi:hypothetical protein ILYODFUR_032396 [Ilyodon furcidens]|uniref:Protein kinase domain-containing protein n=1 Tax=Ilyodon furcidens TaxID=33524 RepID=A0ABV0SU32_9TELE
MCSIFPALKEPLEKCQFDDEKSQDKLNRDPPAEQKMTAEAAKELDELCFLSAQSLPSLKVSKHFQVLKLLGEGSYGKVMLALHRKRGTPMALKFFPRKSTSLSSFLREYNLSLAYCTHPSLTKALGIFFSTPSYYVFAQQACLYGDLYSVVVSEVSLKPRISGFFRCCLKNPYSQ